MTDVSNTTPLRQALQTGPAVIGSWMGLADPAIAEVLCEAGCRWLGIDLEHSTTTLAQAGALIQTARAAGVDPMVRLSTNDATQIARVMDAGATGIIVPHVNSRADVDRAYQAMHYPPAGTRGTGLSRAQGWGERFTEYRQWLGRSAVLVAQIEHFEALNHLDAIFSHPGLDAYMIGPYDLSSSLGHAGDFTPEPFLAAIDSVKAAAARHGVAAGYHLVEPNPDELARLVAEGYRFVAYSVDFRLLARGFRSGLAGLERS